LTPPPAAFEGKTAGGYQGALFGPSTAPFDRESDETVRGVSEGTFWTPPGPFSAPGGHFGAVLGPKGQKEPNYYRLDGEKFAVGLTGKGGEG
jgi:hypothetical protein